MHGLHDSPSLDTVLFMAPFAVLLVLAMFGLDERFACGRNRARHLRPGFCEVDRHGHGELRDPDGKTPKMARPDRPAKGRRGNPFVTRYESAAVDLETPSHPI